MGGWDFAGAIFQEYLDKIKERLRCPPLAILDAEHERRDDWWHLVLDDDDDDDDAHDDDKAELLRILEG